MEHEPQWRWKEYESPEWTRILNYIHGRNDPLLYDLFYLADTAAAIHYLWLANHRAAIPQSHPFMVTCDLLENIRVNAIWDDPAGRRAWNSKISLFSGRSRLVHELNCYNLTTPQELDCFINFFLNDCRTILNRHITRVLDSPTDSYLYNIGIQIEKI